MAEQTNRAGYALLAVLWISLGASAMGITIALEARSAIATAKNRIALSAARWLSEGCATELRRHSTDSLRMAIDRGAEYARQRWNDLPVVIAAAVQSGESGCEVSARPLGARFPANATSADTLVRFLRAAGIAGELGDSLAEALLDWTDSDTVPRPGGAEREWYTARGRAEPSNQPFLDVRELRLIRGFESGLDTLFEIESSPTSLYHALPARLMTVPGFDDELVGHVLEARTQHEPIASFLELSQGLSREGRDQFDRASPQLVASVVLQPEAWIVLIRGHAGLPRVTSVLELRIAIGGNGLIVEQRRSWVE